MLYSSGHQRGDKIGNMNCSNMFQIGSHHRDQTDFLKSGSHSLIQDRVAQFHAENAKNHAERFSINSHEQIKSENGQKEEFIKIITKIRT